MSTPALPGISSDGQRRARQTGEWLWRTDGHGQRQTERTQKRQGPHIDRQIHTDGRKQRERERERERGEEREGLRHSAPYRPISEHSDILTSPQGLGAGRACTHSQKTHTVHMHTITPGTHTQY